MRNIGDFRTKEQILDALGLETRKGLADYLLPALGIFGAGLLIGVGTGLLVAPKSGREMREQLGARLSRSPRWSREAMEDVGIAGGSGMASPLRS